MLVFNHNWQRNLNYVFPENLHSTDIAFVLIFFSTERNFTIQITMEFVYYRYIDQASSIQRRCLLNKNCSDVTDTGEFCWSGIGEYFYGYALQIIPDYIATAFYLDEFFEKDVESLGYLQFAMSLIAFFACFGWK